MLPKSSSIHSSSLTTCVSAGSSHARGLRQTTPRPDHRQRPVPTIAGPRAPPDAGGQVPAPSEEQREETEEEQGDFGLGANRRQQKAGGRSHHPPEREDPPGENVPATPLDGEQ